MKKFKIGSAFLGIFLLITELKSEFQTKDILSSTVAGSIENEFKNELAKRYLRDTLYQRYRENDNTLNERVIIDRYFECLLFKWQSMGEFARGITPGDLKEMHYIMTGEITEIQDITEQKLADEFLHFNEIFFSKSDLPFSEYERKRLLENFFDQYAREMVLYLMWSDLKKSQENS